MEYYARNPLEVFAVDENMERLTGSIPYTSLIWHRRYNSPGEFQMQVLSDIYDPSWAFIVCSDRPETGIVQKVEYGDTSLTPDGKDTVTVSGFFLETLLYDVAFLVEETGEETVEIEAPRNSNRGYSGGQEPLEVYWSTVANKYVYRDKESGLIKDNDGNTVAFGGIEKVDYWWNGKQTSDTGGGPDGTDPLYYIDKKGYYTSDGGKTITHVAYGTTDLPGDDEKNTDDVQLHVGGKYFYELPGGQLVMVTGVASERSDTYWVQYKKWDRGPKTKTIQVKGPWQRTDIGAPEEEGDSVELVIKWVRNFFTNEWQFEEPTFEGETMMLDLSLKYLGDVVYDTLKRIDASPRVQYDFESDTTVFSVYRGDDLTQDAMQASNDSEPAEAMVLSSRSARVTRAAALPSGYTPIEYIESTGTQYIDTGVTPAGDICITIDFQASTVSGNWYAIAGSRGDASHNYENNICFFIDGSTGTYRTDYGSSAVSFGSADTARHTVIKDAGKTKFDGSVVADAQYESLGGDLPIFVFACDEQGEANFRSSIKVYGCSIEIGASFVRDFIPVKRESDGAVGLYDIIGGQLYANEGNGSFQAGPEADISDQLAYDANAQGYIGTVPPTEGFTGFDVTVAQNAFSYSGHVFLSWNTQADGRGTTYNPGDLYTLTSGNDVLYAVWSQAEDPEQPVNPGEPDEAFPYAVFNDTWGSMYGYTASVDDSNYKNTNYVLYDYDQPDGFTDNGYPKPEGVVSTDEQGYLITTGWYIPYTAQQGYYEVTVGEDGERRRETFLDMRDEDPSCDSTWPRGQQSFDEPRSGSWFAISSNDEIEEFLKGEGLVPCKDIYEGYPQSLKDAGTTDLKNNYGKVYSLDTGTLNTDGYIRDYDLGDLVDWGIYKLGIQRTGRITEAEEVYESGNIQINLTIGDELISLMDKARRK